MYWTLELASYLSDAPWPATKDELIDYAIRTGAPLEVVVQKGSGNRSLDRAAREHVLAKWRFKPAMRNGQAVQAYGLVPVVFSMQ